MSVPSYGVRRAGAADARALAVLRYEFRAALAPAVEAEAAFLERCAAWMTARLVSESPWRCWVAERDGAVLGQLWLELIEKVPNPVAERERHAYVTNVYVRPSARRQGVGGRLLETALEWSRVQGVDSIVLWPSDESLALYARFGFRDSGQLWEAKLFR